MTAQCGACGAPTGDSAHLCTGCTQRLRGALADLPPLLDELDTARARQTSMPASAIGDDTCQHHGDCGCGVSLPWNDKASRVAAGRLQPPPRAEIGPTGIDPEVARIIEGVRLGIAADRADQARAAAEAKAAEEAERARQLAALEAMPLIGRDGHR